jgi:hypothetical protein
MTATALRSITLCILAGLLYGCQTNSSRDNLVGLSVDEVRRLFVGNTVESYNLNTSFTSFTYYDPGGRAVQERLWAHRNGSWSIQDDGRICLAFGNRRPKCRNIVKQDGRYYKVRPDKSGQPEKIVRYRYFAAGNALAER